MSCQGGGGGITYLYPFGPHPTCAPGGTCFCTCTAQGGPDASCNGAAGTCATGLECVDHFCSAGGYEPAGGPCLSDRDCADGTSCSYPADGGAPTCQARLPAGSACTPPGNGPCGGFCGPTGDAGACVSLCGSM
ncbi:MAG TPA: hypothetical protein VF765_04640 [Polyangiaceae bacterium]